MIGYKEFEETVFNWLMTKHKEDPTFNFSLRRKATKGAELNHFIGTKNSKYFSTTFWYISVAYPGNAAELISLSFRLNEKGYSYIFQFLQTKNPHNDQNRFCLDLIRELKPIIKKNFPTYYESDEKNKMESFGFNSAQPYYGSVEALLKDVDVDIQKLLPLVDSQMQIIKDLHPEFNAYRYSEANLNSMLEDLKKRRAKYSKVVPDQPILKDEEEKPKKTYKPPLNQILYGPPGTGKSYNTINKAIAIIDGVDEKELVDFYKNRSAIKEQFDRMTITDLENPLGQIGFITFHQSMSYEDFIEGIKPKKPLATDSFVTYEVQDGIFKKLCSIAKSNYENSKKQNKNKLPFKDVFLKLQEDWELDRFMKFPLKTEGYDYTIIGFTDTSIQFKKASGGTSHTLSISTLEDLYYGKEINFKQGVGIYYPAVLQKLQSYSGNEKLRVEEKSYVLIIDEINRGNVSQIFGELITLIEDDKRLGKDEFLQVTLPYSKDKFSVPPNLYIIGTMNTADRSVEALDTALRRRFVFDEMMPKTEILEPKKIICRFLNLEDDSEIDEEEFLAESSMLYKLLGIDNNFLENAEMENEEKGWQESDLKIEDSEFTGIRLDYLLETINKRIEKLLSRDNCIGHSYFLKVYSIKDLMDSFKNEIIPLLQEYFYGDYGKISLVLGKGFVDDDSVKTNAKLNFFAKADYYDSMDSYLEKRVWKIKQIETEEEFKEAINLLFNK